jgi:hypothetical protein
MLYKYLNEDGTACNGGIGGWSLPTQGEDGTWTPGEWMPPIEGDLVPCANGYHVCEEDHLLMWAGPALFEVEICGEQIRCDDKVVVRQARLLRRLNWNDRTARLFACDCAERVIHLCGDDPRPRRAIEVSRRYAIGEATDDELAAAWAAASAAARAAASAAAWAASAAARAAASAAAWAARAAAWAAASAAVSAASAAERAWQLSRLLEYVQGGSDG